MKYAILPGGSGRRTVRNEVFSVSSSSQHLSQSQSQPESQSQSQSYFQNSYGSFPSSLPLPDPLDDRVMVMPPAPLTQPSYPPRYNVNEGPSGLLRHTRNVVNTKQPCDTSHPARVSNPGRVAAQDTAAAGVKRRRAMTSSSSGYVAPPSMTQSRLTILPHHTDALSSYSPSLSHHHQSKQYRAAFTAPEPLYHHERSNRRVAEPNGRAADGVDASGLGVHRRGADATTTVLTASLPHINATSMHHQASENGEGSAAAVAAPAVLSEESAALMANALQGIHNILQQQLLFFDREALHQRASVEALEAVASRLQKGLTGIESTLQRLCDALERPAAVVSMTEMPLQDKDANAGKREGPHHPCTRAQKRARSTPAAAAADDNDDDDELRENARKRAVASHIRDPPPPPKPPIPPPDVISLAPQEEEPNRRTQRTEEHYPLPSPHDIHHHHRHQGENGGKKKSLVVEPDGGGGEERGAAYHHHHHDYQDEEEEGKALQRSSYDNSEPAAAVSRGIPLSPHTRKGKTTKTSPEREGGKGPHGGCACAASIRTTITAESDRGNVNSWEREEKEDEEGKGKQSNGEDKDKVVAHKEEEALTLGDMLECSGLHPKSPSALSISWFDSENPDNIVLL